MATIPELLDGHVTLEVECLGRPYLNGYIGQTGNRTRAVDVHALPVREAGSVAGGARTSIREDDIANNFRRQRQVRDGIVFIGVAQEKAQACNGKKVNGQFQFDRDKTVYVNHYYFSIDDADFGPLFIKVCSFGHA